MTDRGSGTGRRRVRLVRGGAFLLAACLMTQVVGAAGYPGAKAVNSAHLNEAISLLAFQDKKKRDCVENLQ